MKGDIQIYIYIFFWVGRIQNSMVEGWTSEINAKVVKTLELYHQKYKEKRDTPRPKVLIPERTDMWILDQITHQIRALEEKAASKTSNYDKWSNEKWKSNE